MRWMTAAVLAVLGNLMLGVVPLLSSESLPTADELERKAILYRVENVNRGYVRMHVIDEAPGPRASERLYEITFDKNRTRQIRRCRQRGQSEWGESQKIIATPNVYIKDDEHVGETTPIVIRPPDTKSPRKRVPVLNPQPLGMDIGGADLLHTSHVESLLNRSDRTAPTVHSDHREGLDTWRIEYQEKFDGKTGMNVKLWIAPNQGFSVVGIEVRADHNGKPYICTFSSHLQQYPSGDVWYPSRLTKVETDGGRVIGHQDVVIEEAHFGGPLDEKVFSLAGLDPKLGRDVIDSTSGQPWGKIWDGSDLVDPIEPRGSSAPLNRRPWYLWIAASGLGLLAMYYLRRVLQQRRKSTQ